MYGINGFSGGFGGRGVFGSNCYFNTVFLVFNFSCTRIKDDNLLTRFDPLLTFCGVNAGLPWPL